MRRLRSPLLTVLLAAALTGCSVISVDLTPRVRPLEETTVEGQGDAKILIVDISGVISDEGITPILSVGSAPARVPLLVRLREELTKAEKDPKVRAVVLRINSPGGTVTASDIVYRELMLFRERTRRPVVAVLMDLAASGGYYVALAADTIVAHPTTVTGSIGTIMVSVNAEGLMQKIGVTPVTIKSGARKDMGSPFRTLTPEERAIFQSVIDDLHRQFTDKVAERRRLAPDVVKNLADGRVYTADQALAAKLIDQIGYMPEALGQARRAAGVEQARIVVYARPREYRATYYARADVPTGSLEASLAQLAAVAGLGPRFLYLWWP
jgi:protease-4